MAANKVETEARITATSYAEIPENFRETVPFVCTDIKEIRALFFCGERVIFYDACSFQRHSGLPSPERIILTNFFKKRGAVIFITRCILMELAGERHILPKQIVDFMQALSDAGLRVVLFNEEHVRDILAECFSSQKRINEYLLWAVRTVKTPVSSIMDALKSDKKLYAAVIEGKNLKSSDLYQKFFAGARGCKAHDDNPGEELLSVCLHVLANLPGLPAGKLCVVTDDKGAAGRIDSVMRKSGFQNPAARIILYSTPKLAQHMYHEHDNLTWDNLVNLLSAGISGNITVMGFTPFDIAVQEKISMSPRDLARKITEPNGISIVF